ncbi:hypothetical protein OSB04_030771 [Centaurea solstitialis]|uniref:WRKY domain-containing protein n=1 Tax=Centaurea solstitialis TaxID=347529 RepID=A0AA38SFT9_9ASTR|nr:hypothetical protein OSB04_030771 [Centaurea solstitialis]
MHDLLVLPDLKTLKLCLPTAKLVQKFLSLERYQVPIFSGLWNFSFMIGHCEALPFSVQLDMEENFLKLEKCVKYMNGEGCMDENAELVRQASALYLRRHWTIEKLSVFDTRRLKYCLLMECNEMQMLVHQEDIFEDRNKATNHGEEAMLGSLQFLAVHFMKKLQRISMGPIGRKSLSCLRVLALHTCPELTSIFTGCLLDNFENLTELIVEDCPKVKSLVTLEGTSWSKGPFLPNLKRVSLLDLPGLVSISSGVCIAPQLDTLLVFNCMSLDYLSIMELPRCIKAIKGEIEWWDALKDGKLTWNSVFVQLKRDGGLMDQLAEDMNSLQHFLELPLVPTHPGSSLQVDQNSSRDNRPGCNYQRINLTEIREQVEQLQIDHSMSFFDETGEMSTQKILNADEDIRSQYAGIAVRLWDSPWPMSGKLQNEDTDSGSNVLIHNDAFPKKKKRPVKVNKRMAIRETKRIAIEEPLADGYVWRNYGEKEILGSKYPRCINRYKHNCMARMQVQRSTEDPSFFEVIYRGKHTCSREISTNCSSTVTELASRTVGTRDSSTATESASTINDSSFQHPTTLQPLDFKKKNTRNAEWTKQVETMLKAGFDKPPDDGYAWKKYGKEEVEGENSRGGFKCEPLFGCEREDNREHDTWRMTRRHVKSTADD